MWPFDNYPDGGREMGDHIYKKGGNSRTGYGVKVHQFCDYQCTYCGRSLQDYLDWLNAEIDHVIPQSIDWPNPIKDWVHYEWNIVTVCSACNRFSNRFPVRSAAPTSREQFPELRDAVFLEKRERLLARHEEEREEHSRIMKEWRDKNS